MFKTRQSMVSISDSAERLSDVKSKKRREAYLLQAKRRDSDASHDLSSSRLKDSISNPFTRVEHCALDTSGVTGGGVRGARLDDGVATARTACADE
jgi:hypothetical protein